jgi:uncharacterized membrane protein
VRPVMATWRIIWLRRIIAAPALARSGDAGIDDSFVTELRDSLTPGTAALVALVREMNLEKVLPHIEEHGHLIQTSLDDRLAGQLDATLRAAGSGRG